MLNQNQFPTDISEFTLGLGKIVTLALEEDIRSGDVNAMLVAESATAKARVVARESGVICGRPWFDEVFRQLDESLELSWLVEEGDEVQADKCIVELSGSARTILTGERSALNFLQAISGTATASRQYSKAVQGLDITILDTRKTIPGLRLAQKYAVKIGGCNNHRVGLFDAFLIKENHILACGSIGAAVAQAKLSHPKLPIEVETENLDEVRESLEAGADRIMLDNFDSETLKLAVKQIGGRAEIEISGGIELKDLAQLDLSGIDFLSSGAITKHVTALDLSMRIQIIE